MSNHSDPRSPRWRLRNWQTGVSSEPANGHRLRLTVDKLASPLFGRWKTVAPYPATMRRRTWGQGGAVKFKTQDRDASGLEKRLVAHRHAALKGAAIAAIWLSANAHRAADRIARESAHPGWEVQQFAFSRQHPVKTKGGYHLPGRIRLHPPATVRPFANSFSRRGGARRAWACAQLGQPPPTGVPRDKLRWLRQSRRCCRCRFWHTSCRRDSSRSGRFLPLSLKYRLPQLARSWWEPLSRCRRSRWRWRC